MHTTSSVSKRISNTHLPLSSIPVPQVSPATLLTFTSSISVFNSLIKQKTSYILVLENQLSSTVPNGCSLTFFPLWPSSSDPAVYPLQLQCRLKSSKFNFFFRFSYFFSTYHSSESQPSLVFPQFLQQRTSVSLFILKKSSYKFLCPHKHLHLFLLTYFTFNFQGCYTLVHSLQATQSVIATEGEMRGRGWRQGALAPSDETMKKKA